MRPAGRVTMVRLRTAGHRPAATGRGRATPHRKRHSRHDPAPTGNSPFRPPPGPGGPHPPPSSLPAHDNTRRESVNFTRWSPRFPGAQRRTTRRADTGAVPAARAGTAPTGPAARLEDLPVRAVLDRVPALVAVLQGPAHHIAYVNDAYTEAFGVRPIGTPAEETMPELEELGLLPSSTRSCAAAAPARSNHADFPAAARTPSPAPRSPSPPPTTARGPRTATPRAPSPASSSSPPTSPTRPTPPSGCAPANAASARPPSPSSAPSSRRNSNNPTTCASPPPTSPAAPTRRSAATGTT